MKKRVFIVLLILFGLISLVCAQKVGIEIGNNYIPGENVNFIISVYDDDNNKINEEVLYVILDYYSEVIDKGSVISGEESSFKIPENGIQGHWAIVAKYDGKEYKQLFNVGELEKADIHLEGDNLIIKNIGNVPYQKRISISIGEHYETALVTLDIGQTKQIRLTAPDGKYNVKISDGTEENTFEKEVSLTGNVIGLESIMGKSFLNKYPLIVLFFIAIVIVAIIVFILKIIKKKK